MSVQTLLSETIYNPLLVPLSLGFAAPENLLYTDEPSLSILVLEYLKTAYETCRIIPPVLGIPWPIHSPVNHFSAAAFNLMSHT